MRGVRFLSFEPLSEEACAVPGVTRPKYSRVTLVPWHAVGIVRRLSPGAGLVRKDPKNTPKTSLGEPWNIHTGEPVDTLDRHPFASAEARARATPVQRADLARCVQLNGAVLDWPCGSGKTLFGLLFGSAWADPDRADAERPKGIAKCLVLAPSTTVLQWRDQANRWLDPRVRVGYVTQGKPSVRRRRETCYHVDDAVVLKLRRYGPETEVLRCRSTWRADELSVEERALLRKAGARRDDVTTWQIVDDLGKVLGEYPTEDEARAATKTWAPSEDYDMLVVGWGLMADAELTNALLAWAPRVVVIDEAHRAKGDGSRWKRVVTRDPATGAIDESFHRKAGVAGNTSLFCESAGVVLAMTATPQANLPINWWGILDLYDPRGFGTYHQFGVRYAAGVEKVRGGMEHGTSFWDYSGLSNVEELRDRLAMVRVARDKSETHAGLPALQMEFVELTLANAGRVDAKAIVSELGSTSEEGVTTRMAVELAMSCEQKIPWAVDWVCARLREGMKLVVFTLLKSNGRSLYAAVKAAVERDKALDGCLVLHGDGETDIDDRRGLVSDLVGTAGPGGVRGGGAPRGGVLIGTVNAWGEAIDGMQFVDAAAVLTVPVTPRQVIQLAGRFERLGGEKSVTVTFVRMAGTIDERIWSRVGEKLKMVHEVRGDEGALKLGEEFRGESPQSEAAALTAMADLLESWEAVREAADDEPWE